MGLLYVCGLEQRELGIIYGCSTTAMKKRLATLRRRLDCGTKDELAGVYIKCGYLDVMYITMMLINQNRHNEAVAFVQQIEVRDVRQH